MSSAPITPKFQELAPHIMREIMAMLPLSAEDAAAVLGNMGVETGGFMLRLEEGKPKESQGYGWCQWTGYDPNKSDRRLLFEEWCDANGFPEVRDNPSTVDEGLYSAACLGFYVYESSETWEKRYITTGATIGGVFYPPLAACPDLEAKTIAFMKVYERPGTPHEDWRIEMAREALRLYRGGEPEEESSMPYPRICISSGHGKYVRGASGIIDEVDEARRVVKALSAELSARGVEVTIYNDDVSKTQSENLKRIVDFHNGKTRDLDVSVHFNAYEQVEKPMGTEVLYVTQQALAAEVSLAIADAGDLINRGAKKRTDLYFLNNTEMPAILLEVCFVDSEADCDLYGEHFDDICDAIATVLGGPGEAEIERPPVRPPTEVATARVDIEVSGDVIVSVNGVIVGD